MAFKNIQTNRGRKTIIYKNDKNNLIIHYEFIMSCVGIITIIFKYYVISKMNLAFS